MVRDWEAVKPKTSLMLKSFLTVAWRNLVRNKIFSAINILGLSLGIACCLLIAVFIENEYSYDKFHDQRNAIFRLMRVAPDQSIESRIPYVSAPYAPALLNDFASHVEEAVRVMSGGALITVGNRSFTEKKVILTDPGFFSMFSFELIQGTRQDALNEPGDVVLTESTARKYFGNENALGKVLRVDNETDFRVSGIIEDAPKNSSLKFDIIGPLQNYSQAPWFNEWTSNTLLTYVRLDKPESRQHLEKNFPQFVQKYMGHEMLTSGYKFDLALTPLTDIYFEPSLPFDPVKHGDRKVVFIFLTIAILILLIACINFMNLSTIRALERSKEVGIRKTMGAFRKQLIVQFIGESVLITSISSVLALVLLKIVMPIYARLMDNEVSMPWSAPWLYAIVGAIILIAGAGAGCYPAFFMAAFSPIEALKGKLRTGRASIVFRQALVVVQFAISVLLITGTIVIIRQLDFVKNKELGYNQEQMLVVPLDNENIVRNIATFKKELERTGGVLSVSAMSGEPGGFYDMMNFSVEGKNDEISKLRTVFTDFEYVETLGLKVIAGRDFSPQFGTDSSEAVLINRTAAQHLGWTPETAVNKWLQNRFTEGNRKKIIGVVEDFNFLSLKEKMQPLVISPGDDKRVALIRVAPGNTTETVNSIATIYSKVAPAYPFDYNFLDSKFDALYRDDIRQKQLVSIFAGLAIFIACLGLFGLTSFTASRRLKEIGVRKVLGSSERRIILLLSKDVLKPVALATVLAIPLAAAVMTRWLQGFAYQAPLSAWIFAAAGLLTFAVAVITISFTAVAASRKNPAQILRSQ